MSKTRRRSEEGGNGPKEEGEPDKKVLKSRSDRLESVYRVGTGLWDWRSRVFLVWYGVDSEVTDHSKRTNTHTEYGRVARVVYERLTHRLLRGTTSRSTGTLTTSPPPPVKSVSLTEGVRLPSSLLRQESDGDFRGRDRGPDFVRDYIGVPVERREY